MSHAAMEANDKLRRALIQGAASTRTDTETMMKSLAAEIAMDIQTIDYILDVHGLTMQQFMDISKKPIFQNFLNEATVLWGKTSSAKLRIQAKMEASLESALPVLANQLMTGDLTNAKVLLVQAMMKGGGIGVNEQQANSGTGISISINMTATREKDTPSITIDHDANEM